jgi:hypothetical protein
MIQKSLFTFLLLGTGFIAQAQTISAFINTSKDAVKISLDNLKIGNIKLGIDTIRTGNDTILLGSDTLKIGSILIVNKKEAEAPNFKTIIKIGDASYGRPSEGEYGWIKGDFKKTKIEISKSPRKLKNTETNWWIFDLGFANFIDKSPTLYWLAANPNSPSVYPAIYPGPVMSPENFSLINKKSTNVNVWVVTQKLNLYQHKINLKYGLGIEMFNFRFEKSISFREDIPTNVKFDVIPFTKNKLLVKYLTVPVQFNFSPNPYNKKAFYASIGMSAGYLWNAKNKQISGERGKEKFRGNFNLNDWRFATIGELGVGSVRLYGSFANSNLFNKNQSFIDMQPFAVGLRFSKF